MAMANDKKYTHFIAIDFGTAGCGVAILLNSDNPKEVPRAFTQWNPGMLSTKGPTIMLLDHNQECEAFGVKARDKYQRKAVKYKHEIKNYYLFEYFKMNLYEETNVSHQLMIKAVDGKELPVVTVFSKALQHMKTTVLDYLNKQIENPARSICWIVTVPAIWSPAAKQVMRVAAEKANFTTEKDSLLLALEPEAASLQCIENIEDIVNDSTSGHHLVVDCGGGTVDIVAHKWLRVHPGNKLCVDETHKVHGGPCGSFAVNNEFSKLLLKILRIDESDMRPRCGVQWNKLIYDEFEKAKCSFESCSLEHEATVAISNNICKYVKSLHNKAISELIDDHKRNFEKDTDLFQRLQNFALKLHVTIAKVITNYNELRWDEEEGGIVIPSVVLAILFIPVIDQIVKIIGDVLKSDNGKSIKSIYMVGGFSESKFLFNEVSNYFSSSQVKVKTTTSPGLSVLFGSVKFGKHCDTIRSRIMPQTLGIETWDDFQTDKHDEKRKYTDEETGKSYCMQIFTRFVQIGQSISTEDSNPTQVFRPVQNTDNTCCVSIYGSFEKEPKYINDRNSYLAGEIIIRDLPPPENGIPHPITVRMNVHGTEIVVTAVSNADNKQHPLNLKLDWMKDKFFASKPS